MLWLLFMMVGQTESRIPIPPPIFQVTDGTRVGRNVLLLDRNGPAMALITPEGQIVASHKAKGQGPGEFNMPRCIAVGNGKIFVGDFGKVHVFDLAMTFLYAWRVPNNPRDMVYADNRLYLSITTFPAGKDAIYAYTEKGREKAHVYQHGMETELNMPFVTSLGQDTLYLQPRIGFGLDRLDLQTQKQQRLKLPTPMGLRHIVPVGAFIKKYGQSQHAYLQWRTQWSEPAGIAAVANRYIVLSFEDIEPDLVTRTYHATVVDLQTERPIAAWIPCPGRLVMGGDVAYFAVETDHPDTDLMLQGVTIEHLTNQSL